MNSSYMHTQVGTVVIAALAASAALALGAGLFAGFQWEPVVVAALLLAMMVLFATLTVELHDNVLELRFGPGVIRKRIELANIASCEVVRNAWIYGWGIHLTPHGWLYNVAGRSAVQIVTKEGTTFRIGTDDPDNLAQAIRRSLPSR